jgi:hypothetical protein
MVERGERKQTLQLERQGAGCAESTGGGRGGWLGKWAMNVQQTAGHSLVWIFDKYFTSSLSIVVSAFVADIEQWRGPIMLTFESFIPSAPKQRFSEINRSSQMRIIVMVTAALILICVGAAAATTTPRVAATTAEAVNPFQIITNAI